MEEKNKDSLNPFRSALEADESRKSKKQKIAKKPVRVIAKTRFIQPRVSQKLLLSRLPGKFCFEGASSSSSSDVEGEADADAEGEGESDSLIISHSSKYDLTRLKKLIAEKKRVEAQLIEEEKKRPPIFSKPLELNEAERKYLDEKCTPQGKGQCKTIRAGKEEYDRSMAYFREQRKKDWEARRRRREMRRNRREGLPMF